MYNLDPMIKKTGENLIEVGVKEEMGVEVADRVLE